VISHLDNAQAVSRDGLAEIRALVLALRPAALASSPLGDAIERILVAWGRVNAIQVASSIGQLPPLHPDADVTILRALQESLSNVARHAGAGHVRVSLACVEGLVLLTVEDDGRGFDDVTPQDAQRLGLSGMRERVRRFGGHVLVDSSPSAGTSVTLALPLAIVAVPVARIGTPDS